MHLSQSALFQLCVASLCAGGLLSLFSDVLKAMRLWLIPPANRYTVSKIQTLYYPRLKSGKMRKRRELHLLIFFQDVLFCIAGAITLVLLLYWLNNGAFRAIAPLCMVLGFVFYRISISKWVRTLLQWIAFGVETLLYWCCLPFKYLLAIVIAKAKQKVQKHHLKLLIKRRKNFTTKELKSIDKAANKLLPLI